MMNDTVFKKTMESVTKYRAIKLSQQNEGGTIQYQNQINILKSFFTEYLLATEMKNIDTDE